LSYPEDSAGGLMNIDIITVRDDITVRTVIRYLRLLKEALILSKSLDSQGTYSWFTFVKNITSDQNIFDKNKSKIINLFVTYFFSTLGSIIC
jgi:magnesium transporter